MAVLLSEGWLIVRLLCHDSDADDGRVLMSYVYAPRLGVPAVDLIFKLQLFPADVFSGNTERK